jgi:hypothetical protein
MLTKSNGTLAGLLDLSRHNGKLAMARGERILGIILAPVLILFFPHVRAGLVGMIGNGLVDIAVRIFLDEMYLRFALFAGLAFIWCLCRPRGIEWLLELSVRKLVLIGIALFNLLHA